MCEGAREGVKVLVEGRVCVSEGVKVRVGEGGCEGAGVRECLCERERN